MQTPLPTAGSLDSGLGGEMEDGSRTRSSSEEKEANLTPAQSRRKAQNRAAYVVCPTAVATLLTLMQTARLPGAQGTPCT